MLALAYVLVLAIVALGVPLAISLVDRVDAEIETQARGQADLLAVAAVGLLDHAHHADLVRLVDRASRNSRGRVLVVDRRGGVLADSAGPASVGTDFSARPEVAAALKGRATRRTRPSRTLGERIIATGAPVVEGGRVAGAVRVTQSVAAAHRAVRRQILEIALVALVVLLAGLGVGALLAGQIARPLRRLQAAAQAVAGGDMAVRAPVEGSSEQRSLAASFNDMTRRLGDVMRSQEEFVADASHQLRTPLAGLRLLLEEMRAEQLPPQAAKDLEAGMREVDRLARTVTDLLVLSDAGQDAPHGERVSLGDAAARAAERWSAYAAQRQITIRVAAAPGAGTVWCARLDLDRALDAVIENALRYSPVASVVTVATAAGGLSVVDEGPGVDPEEAEAVFERFHRGTVGRQGPDGSGLGLAITRSMMRRWGGDATIGRRPEGGTIVRLALPPAHGATGSHGDFAQR